MLLVTFQVKEGYAEEDVLIPNKEKDAVLQSSPALFSHFSCLFCSVLEVGGSAEISGKTQLISVCKLEEEFEKFSSY